MRAPFKLRQRDFGHPTRCAAPGLQVRDSHSSDGECEVVCCSGNYAVKLGDPVTGRKTFSVSAAIPLGESVICFETRTPNFPISLRRVADGLETQDTCRNLLLTPHGTPSRTVHLVILPHSKSQWQSGRAGPTLRTCESYQNPLQER